jgi:RNA polymerase sigma-70 factor (ECF subfamily)
MTETNVSLILRVRNPADGRSWKEFVDLYEPLLLNYVRSRGLSEHDARDVVQQIFVSLLRALPTFELNKTRGRFRTWLWQVASNAIADWARRQRRQAKAETQWLEQLSSEEAGSNPELEIEWRDAYRKRILQVVLERMKSRTHPKTWSCFEQHLQRGRPAADVALELGMTANAVYVAAARVLARVRQQCADEYLEEFDDA